MLVPQKDMPTVFNCRFLSYFMPGQTEQYLTEAIKRQFNVDMTENPIGSSFSSGLNVAKPRVMFYFQRMIFNFNFVSCLMAFCKLKEFLFRIPLSLCLTILKKAITQIKIVFPIN